MKQKAAVLMALLDSEWRTIDGLFEKLEKQQAKATASEADVVFSAYLIHNIYGAIEELLKQVAITFENRLEDLSQFHAELLRRMTLIIPGIRPAFLSMETHTALQELRRFRHVFRHAYDFELDARRVQEVAAVGLNVRGFRS